MNGTAVGLRLRQGLTMLVLLSGLAVIGTTILIAAPPINEPSETAPLPFGTKLAVTGEVVMIEGHVQIVNDTSGRAKDANLVMDHLYIAQMEGDEAFQFHVNEKTQMDDGLRVGDKVEVLAAQNGQALSIKKRE